MPDEVYSDEFFQANKMKMNDHFYTIANYILKEACDNANLDLENFDHIPRERVGFYLSNLGECLAQILQIDNYKGGKLMTATNFGVTGALALHHNIRGHQVTNTNGCAASLYSLGDAYRQI